MRPAFLGCRLWAACWPVSYRGIFPPAMPSPRWRGWHSCRSSHSLPARPRCGTWTDLRHKLRAVRAALRRHRNVTEAFRARLGRRRSRRYGLLEFIEQRIHRQDDKEIDGSGDEQERNEGVEKITILDLAAVNVKDQI